MKNKILSFLLVLSLLSMAAVNASAAHPAPDLTDNGSLTFLMELDGVPLDDGKLNLYKVGEITDEDGNFFFRLIDGRKIFLSEEIDQILAEEMLTLAKSAGLTKLSVTIEEGKAVFTDLPVGLYVVWQDAVDATEGLSAIQPFLISVPRFQNGTYELDVLAKPKNAPEAVPTEPTTPPSTTTPDEELPQTGQLNWPVPAMALAGALLFVFGWILCIREKRISHEK